MANQTIIYMKEILLIILITAAGMIQTIGQIIYPGKDPGKAIVNTMSGNQVVLENGAIRMKFANERGRILIKSFEDKITGEQLTLNNVALFELILPDNNIISSDEFILVTPPLISGITPEPAAITYVNRLPGKKYSATLRNNRLGLIVSWEAHLRDGSNYVRQSFTFSSNDVCEISRINLIKLPLNINIRKEGTVDGVPIVHNNMFFAVENPLSKVEEIRKIEKGKITSDLTSSLPLYSPIKSSGSCTVSSVWGTTPAGQLRRGFLYYIERERAAPYHQMSFYNSFGDLAWFDRKMSERACLERIRWIGDSLIVKRKVDFKGFLFDDGWDDPKTLWQFNSGFPDGFSNMKKAAESYNASLGVWISPFGGYREPKKQRLEYGKQQNPPFETNDYGFSLAGPVYYKRYKEVLIDFVKKYDIIMLKFDGVASRYKEDLAAFLRVTSEVRAVKPDMYFFLTTGTYPSPFFLKYGDVVWRGGEDWYSAGEGSQRQQWITYRDGDVYKNVVNRSPLYPLNALQQMGIFVSDIRDEKYKNYPGAFEMTDKDVSDDIWAAIGTGTSVQGLYINVYRMSKTAWDCLGAALNWAKSNESIMDDTHGVGGDPLKGEVYGFASWSPEKGVLSLRNPSSIEKSFNVDVSRVFDIPEEYVGNMYLFYDVKNGDKNPVAEGGSFKLSFEPFEVKIFNAVLSK